METKDFDTIQEILRYIQKQKAIFEKDNDNDNDKMNEKCIYCVKVLFLKNFEVFRANEKAYIDIEKAKKLQREGILEILE